LLLKFWPTPKEEEDHTNIKRNHGENFETEKNIYETLSSAQLVELVNLSIIYKYKAGQNNQFTFKIHNRDAVMDSHKTKQ